MARETQDRLTGLLFATFGSLVACVLLGIFFLSPLRERIENKLFDIRIRLAPKIVSPDSVAVIAIDEPSIATLDGPLAKDLSPESMLRLIQAALASEPALVVALLPPQALSYQDEAFEPISQLAQVDPRTLLATFGIGDDLTLLPRSFLTLPADQIVNAELERNFRRAVVRTITVAAKSEGSRANETKDRPPMRTLFTAIGNRLAPTTMAAIASESGHAESLHALQVGLNYFAADQFLQISASALLREHQDPRLKGRVVLIGYTAYRPFTLVVREATFVNTPWQSDGDDLKEGLPAVLIHASAVANLLHKRWLRTAPQWTEIVHIIAVSAFGLSVWWLGSGLGSLLFIVGWGLILLAHALAFSASINMPLATSVVFSSLATVVGGLWRLRLEARLRAAYEAHEAAERQIAQIQDRFLDRFARELAVLNGKISALLTRNNQLAAGSGTIQKVYSKAVGSCDELTEYLRGIQQFAGTRGQAKVNAQLPSIDVVPIMHKVSRQFESRRQEGKVTVQLDETSLSGIERARCDGTLTEQILFNLLSNAIKYSPVGGKVSIRIFADSRTVKIAVKDQGPGIPAEFQERIFEKFYRVKDDFVYKVKGHGLGLYLSRYFATQMKAQITVVSAPGHGSEFTLTMPRALNAEV